MKVIAKIYNGFETKFGIPRQSLITDIKSEIVFEKRFRNPDAIRGLDGFSHIWLIWNFSESELENWSPTVRPPRLGGNKKVGVFATRSPFRPNPIGLTVVKLEEIIYDKVRGPVLVVSGADLLNGTPIYDIKPYLPKFDCVNNAKGGFSEETIGQFTEVQFSQNTEILVSPKTLGEISLLLSQSPKPAYQNDENKIYGMQYSGYEIKFIYKDNKIFVLNIENE